MRSVPTAPRVQRSIDRLNFRSDEEVTVYRALASARERLPEFEGLSLSANVPVQVRAGRVFIVDLLVCHRGKAGVIEVDGPHHHGRAGADRTRDRLLEDAGIALVERVLVEDVTSPEELATIVRRFLHHLAAA